MYDLTEIYTDPVHFSTFITYFTVFSHCMYDVHFIVRFAAGVQVVKTLPYVILSLEY